MPLNTLDIIEKLLAIPMTFRNFTANTDEAYIQYGLSSQECTELQDLGLPSRIKNAKHHFDTYDLSNLSLHMQKPSVQRLAMRSWGALLKKNQARVILEYYLEPNNENDSTNIKNVNTPSLQLMTHEQGSVSVDPNCQGPLWQSKVNLHHPTPLFDSEQKALLKRVDEFEFFMLPEGIRWDTGFIREHKIAECGGASKYLCELAKEHSITARQSFGILIASPYSTCHYWTEFQLNHQWVAIDPLLLKVLRNTARLDPQIWTYDASPEAIFLKLCNVSGFDTDAYPVLGRSVDQPYQVNPIATHNGQQIEISLKCTLLNNQN